MTIRPTAGAWLAGTLALALSLAAPASEQEELLRLKNTVLNLMDALVEQGVLQRAQADALVQAAEEKAAVDAATVVESADAAETPPVDAGGKTVVRVPYVPEFVKEQIRSEVRRELREDVLQDVKQVAKTERWGTPGALPDWVSRFKLKGEFRVREQRDGFADSNPGTLSVLNPYFDIVALNDAGGLGFAGQDERLNTSEDRNRLRAQLRLGIEAAVTEGVKFGARITTGNQRDPVSLNQTLGNTGRRYDVQLDQAYIQYDDRNLDGYPWLTAWAGRTPNPFFSTDMVWDPDLQFEGAAATFRYNVGGSGTLLDLEDRSKTATLTVGAFPLDEFELSSRDRWLLGAQAGFQYVPNNVASFRFGAAYYDYRHVTGRRSAFSTLDCDQQEFAYTAPEFTQQGNTYFDICNDLDPRTNLLALATDYNLVNLTAEADFAFFAPIHAIVTADVVKNIGYDADEVVERTGGVAYLYDPAVERTTGVNLQLLVGWPKVTKFGDWQVFGGYKYLQRDAVLDAFTDSDFHLGGTDAEGYVLGANVGLAANTWVRARWISTDEIDGPAFYGIDTLQLDLNTRF